MKATMPPHTLLLVPGLLSLLIAYTSHASETGGGKALHSRCVGTLEAGARTPAPIDPYPLMAAGWGPELGGGRMASRWAEDWSGMKADGHAPGLKSIPLGDAADLTVGAELRLLHALSDNARLVHGNDFEQTQLRAIVGGAMRLSPHLRFYGELGTGQVDGRRDVATPNLQNDISLQQLFVEARSNVGDTLLGAMLGRQEFSDGPRQLISLSDGPNLHRSWNGVRLYAHGTRYRLGAFDLRATRLGRAAFDEKVNHAEKLQGLNASFIVSRGEGPNTYLEPFWLHTENPTLRLGGQSGLDDRGTFGARLWGRVGKARFDWTVARQSGRSIDNRRIDAWGLFAVHGLVLSDSGWKPQLTARIDIASGGGAYGTGPVRDFNPLYASSSYLGEGQFLGLSNLLMIAPGIAVSPTPRSKLSLEYSHARRLQDSDAIYAGGMRAYAGTQDVPGHYIGGLIRMSGSWSTTPNLTLSANLEYFAAGDVLARAGYSSAGYGNVSATYRY